MRDGKVDAEKIRIVPLHQNNLAMTDQSVTLTRTINASAPRIWKALTDPAEIKQYMFGTNTETTWEKGSTITYSGEYKGKAYEDKGTVIDIVPNKLLHTTHYSPLSGKPDVPENYAHVTYELEEQGNQTIFKLTQDHIENEEERTHMEQNWTMVLDGLQNVVEKK
jgi:uncharacterized protein YndB with AHSA1/START domain